ncbi:MAG: hypothetical protein M0R22_03000, partial [Dehalococcoidia bacterium]|nr:hypothetical protein [Dehalococcoidia bacterium]
MDISRIPDSHNPTRSGTIRNILREYPDLANVVSEFIQNAEDDNSKSISLDIDSKRVCIRNDGDPFDNQDYDRLLQFAQGKWHDRDKIGKFGVGFISCYHLTDSPTIVSGGVRVAIKPNGRVAKTLDPASVLARGARFELPIRRKETLFSAEIAAEPLTSERIESLLQCFAQQFRDCALFLSKVRILEAFQGHGERRHLLCRCERRCPNGASGKRLDAVTQLTQVLVRTVSLDSGTGQYRTESHLWDVYTRDCQGTYLADNEGEPPGRTGIALAVARTPKAKPHLGMLHAYLPTNIHTGFQFNVNADFAPLAGRGGIRGDEGKEGSWNKWLLRQLGILLADCSEEIGARCAHVKDFYDLLPLEVGEEHQVLSELVDSFLDQVATKRVVYTYGGWSCPTEALSSDSTIRSLGTDLDSRLVHPQVYASTAGERLLGRLGVPDFGCKELVGRLSTLLPTAIPVSQAPRLVNTPQKVRRILEYIGAHPYSGLDGDIRGVAMALDSAGWLRRLALEPPQLYRTERVALERILKGAGIALLDKRVVSAESRDLVRRLVPEFGVKNLINYLRQYSDRTAGKPMRSSPIALLRSRKRILEVYRFLVAVGTSEAVDWGSGALKGTPLLLTHDGRLEVFNGDDAPPYMASAEIRSLMQGCRDVSFVDLSLQRGKRLVLLENSGVPCFTINRVLDYFAARVGDGTALDAASPPLNSREGVLAVYKLLRTSKASPNIIERAKLVPVFLTSKNRLRPLVGGSQGSLTIADRAIDDPLRLDNLLHPQLLSNRELWRWFESTLKVVHLTLLRYVLDYLLPRFAVASDDDKKLLLTFLAKHASSLVGHAEVATALRTRPLLVSLDGESYPGPHLARRLSASTRVFGNSYHYATKESFGGSSAWISAEDWRRLEQLVDVRELPHPRDVVQLASAIASVQPPEIDRANRLLAFMDHHWDLYATESAQLVELKTLAWIPAIDDMEALHVPNELYTREVKRFLGDTFLYVARPDLNAGLAQVLGIHTIPSTDDIVTRLEYLAEHNLAADLNLYVELDNRRDSQPVQCLCGKAVLDVDGKGSYWKAEHVFRSLARGEFGRYRVRLPERLWRFNWLWDRLGVRDEPATCDYVDLLIEISASFVAKPIPEKDSIIVGGALSKLAQSEDLDEELLERLRTTAIVPGSDGYLHRVDDAIIDDYPGIDQVGIQVRVPFAAIPSTAEPLLIRLGTRRVSTCLRREAIEIVGQERDEELTRLLGQVWCEYILSVNLTILGVDS